MKFKRHSVIVDPVIHHHVHPHAMGAQIERMVQLETGVVFYHITGIVPLATILRIEELDGSFGSSASSE